MKLDELDNILNELYQFESFEDYCKNGIQVEGKRNIKIINLGVTLSYDLILDSINKKADAIIVHHGIFGKRFFELKGILKSRIKLLLENDISLIGIHLPMDAQPSIGHNKVISDIIGIKNLEKFKYGFIGENNLNLNIDQIKDKMESFYNINFKNLINLNSIKLIKNSEQIPYKVCVISGDSYKYFEEAIGKEVDLFVCGSINEYIPAIAKEASKSILVLGHYNCELPGILYLSNFLREKYELETYCNYYENDL